MEILRLVSEEDGASWGSVVEVASSIGLVEESLLAQEGILSDDACADGSVAVRDCRNRASGACCSVSNSEGSATEGEVVVFCFFFVCQEVMFSLLRFSFLGPPAAGGDAGGEKSPDTR